MIVRGRYYHDFQTPIDVVLSHEDSWLVMRSETRDHIVERWPLSDLREVPTANNALTVECPPSPARLEVLDRRAWQRSPWHKRLPEQALKSSPLKGALWLLATGAGGFAGVVLLLFTSHHFPWRWEKKLARLTPIFPKAAVCRGTPEQNEILRKLVKRLYPTYPTDKDFPVSVAVVRRPEVNAVTYFGGEIYLFRGLLEKADSADEIAGVLAHEIEHVRRRHVSEGLLTRISLQILLMHTVGRLNPGLVGRLLELKFNRDQEREADAGGLERMVRTEVSVAALKHFFDKLESNPEAMTLLSTHPSSASRSKWMDDYLSSPARPVLSPEEWHLLQKICDL